MKRILTSIIIFIAIIVIGVIIFVLVRQGQNIISVVNDQNTSTELLQIQTKIKKIKVDSEIQKDNNLLKGQKFADCTEEYAQNLKDEGVISETDQNYQDYYIWDQGVLDDLNLNIKLETDKIYIINYTTNEVIQANISNTNGTENIYSTKDLQL